MECTMHAHAPQVKSVEHEPVVNEEEGKFSGYASVFNVVDRHQDKIVKGAFTHTLNAHPGGRGIKLLWQHLVDAPIGVITELEEDDYGLFMRGQLLLDIQQAREVYQLLKAGAVGGLSIGYQIEKSELDKEGVRIIQEVSLWEISVVTFPANQAAEVRECRAEKITVETKEQFMTSTEIDHLQQAWHAYKQANDERLEGLEKKQHVDAVTVDKLQRLQKAMDEAELRLGQIEVVMERPALGGESPEEGSYKQAFNQYLRKGIEPTSVEVEHKALSVHSDRDGGYVVSPSMSEKMVKHIFETSPIRKLASVTAISTHSIEFIEDRDEAGVGWAHETTPIMNDTSTPSFDKKTISVHEMYAQPRATQKLVDDADIDVEAWLADKLADSFARTENQAFIHGSGDGMPRGLLTYPDGTGWEQIEQIGSGASKAITTDAVMLMLYSLSSSYAKQATFLMNRSVMHQVRALKTEDGHYLWQPSLAEHTPQRLLGVPVMEDAEMQGLETGDLAIALADFKQAYQIVDRKDMRILRDPYTHKPFITFYTTKRLGGDVLQYEAVKLLRVD